MTVSPPAILAVLREVLAVTVRQPAHLLAAQSHAVARRLLLGQRCRREAPHRTAARGVRLDVEPVRELSNEALYL
jgi:hypothetical protein